LGEEVISEMMAFSTAVRVAYWRAARAAELELRKPVVVIVVVAIIVVIIGERRTCVMSSSHVWRLLYVGWGFITMTKWERERPNQGRGEVCVKKEEKKWVCEEDTTGKHETTH
jgi:hypothetical protein